MAGGWGGTIYYYYIIPVLYKEISAFKYAVKKNAPKYANRYTSSVGVLTHSLKNENYDVSRKALFLPKPTATMY
jgi:hypothetical protein